MFYVRCEQITNEGVRGLSDALTHMPLLQSLTINLEA